MTSLLIFCGVLGWGGNLFAFLPSKNRGDCKNSICLPLADVISNMMMPLLHAGTLHNSFYQ